jgi:heme-degrading monooxygenase HmoA
VIGIVHGAPQPRCHLLGAVVDRLVGHPYRRGSEREEKAMMTVVTTVTLKDEATSRWDRAMHERVRAASDMEGWVAVQLLKEVGHPQRRAIIGTWQSREHWASWHDDEAFKATQAELAGLEDGPSRTVWYEVVEEQG